MFKKLLLQLLNILTRTLSYVPALIYGYIFSEFFTKYAVIHLEPPTDVLLKEFMNLKTMLKLS